MQYLKKEELSSVLEVLKRYFNAKYPCTNESNDGTDMSLEDTIKFNAYNKLLNYYHSKYG